MNSRRSWLVWGCGVLVYLVAVLQRSSLGVAAVEASDRFDISASVLSTLAVVQLIVYAGLQIPVGVLLDRVGPRALISSGAILMFLGQLSVAFAEQFWMAVLGRILVGAGDAATFISVLRLLPHWFAGRILPQVSQWTGNLGQLGQLLSALPFAWLLHDVGWTPAFGIAAAMALFSFLIAFGLIRDDPDPDGRQERGESWGQALRQARDALRRPGTQLGFWSHFTTQSPGSMFALLWGFPFLVTGLGYSAGAAAGLLSLLLISGIVAGPILGVLTVRYPLRRSSLVLGIVGVTAATWAVVLARPEEPPSWLVATLIIVLGVGGPGSLISFEFARSFNPLRSHGSATGIVNVGGFVASLTMMFLVGAALDLASTGEDSGLYTWSAFRIAFATQFLVLAVGTAFILITRDRIRRQLRDEEGIRVAPLWVALSRTLRKRSR
ncbi:MFS transporter [Salinibacterium sp. SYSU T00001]|uniref:MFS transporter n=1 Tax=Homoserinimonas sedimenticola TaxID=2986805 RepID=UPI00223627FD|nr:MFS transporter [Salinibacterium sedimenticola]MCW4384512.1 MFS transporter [Salinibacterium sedimenticola]